MTMTLTVQPASRHSAKRASATATTSCAAVASGGSRVRDSSRAG